MPDDRIKNDVLTMQKDGAVICLCVKPEMAQGLAETKFGSTLCHRCHRPLLERMSISFNKAMTLLMMHETLIAPRQLDGVRARYMAYRVQS